MIYHGQATSATPGVAVPLFTSSIKASFVTIYPRIVNGTPNVGQVRIGGKPTAKDNVTLNGATTAIPSGTGMPLNPGDAGVVWPMMAVCPVDLNALYFDVDNTGDGIQFIFGRP